jgi:aspartate kinase
VALVVQKYGGSSVATLERMKSVASKIKVTREAGHDVAVVVSAMAGETDHLLDLVRQANPIYDFEEHDVILSAGEQISAGLMALTLKNMDIPAKSWLGWQMPCQTSGDYGNANIEKMNASLILEDLQKGIVPVIAGFQGLSAEGRVSTLGRGGSDTTAVAIAAALSAEICEIYTDVDGVYTADPRIVPRAKKLNHITYEEMYELASLGAKVLQTRSVEIAMKWGVKVEVKSSFQDIPGTLLLKERTVDKGSPISGLVCSRNEIQVMIDTPHHQTSLVLHQLVLAGIRFDLIIKEAENHILMTVSKSENLRIQKVLQTLKEQNLIKDYHLEPRVCKISIVGLGLKDDSTLLEKLFYTLEQNQIEPSALVASHIRATFLVREELGEKMTQDLHTLYGLDSES